MTSLGLEFTEIGARFLLPIRPCIFHLGVIDILVQRYEVRAWSCSKVNSKLIVAALDLGCLGEC